ncbi:hypothetical protein ALQ62_200115 [Pseudomonas coronafaciens pv. zizaniae]|uniref:type II toxin-antitoxin system RelE/ParE family toxin n=1 Tax=Pseudomonas coronafaciens TaxID=53409 RepID=UPI0006D633F4|nr:type II toxin-antitoxin system RelE/ParE family toxin [Pseudomonas coronafaciens]KPZ29091.1 Uncharacterized protein ALO38_03215 [Pseudomonas coronafaciens pv. zizaniae]RMN26296.1 hypothetical protein ALQ62_200115 [Pseudomonas coronafaciens pv. zizaniae]
MQHHAMKPVEFIGSCKKDLRSFPQAARLEAGFQIETLQRGGVPEDWKPMPSVGAGVYEIRVGCEEGAFRVFYVVNRNDAIYLLHAFQKTTQKTEKRDIDLGKIRYKSLG